MEYYMTHNITHIMSEIYIISEKSKTCHYVWPKNFKRKLIWIEPFQFLLNIMNFHHISKQKLKTTSHVIFEYSRCIYSLKVLIYNGMVSRLTLFCWSYPRSYPEMNRKLLDFACYQMDQSFTSISSLVIWTALMLMKDTFTNIQKSCHQHQYSLIRIRKNTSINIL